MTPNISNILNARFDFRHLLAIITIEEYYGRVDKFTGELIDFLVSDSVYSKFIAAPGSTRKRYHHAYDGGLVQHLCEVYLLAGHMVRSMGYNVTTGKTSSETIEFHRFSYTDLLLAAFLHDCDKLGGPLSSQPKYVPNYSEKTGKRSEAEPYKIAPGYPYVGDVFFRLKGFLDTLSLDRSAHPNLKSAEHALGEDVIWPAEFAEHTLQAAVSYVPTGILSLSVVESVVDGDVSSILTPTSRNAIIHHDGMYSPARKDLQGKETALQRVIHAMDMESSRSAPADQPAGFPRDTDLIELLGHQPYDDDDYRDLMNRIDQMKQNPGPF